MPRSEAPSCTARLIAASIAFSSSQRIAAMNEPTPGSTSLRALAIASASRVTRNSAPAARSARAMFATFATGESMRVTFIVLGCWFLVLSSTKTNNQELRTKNPFRARDVGSNNLLRLAQRNREGLEDRLRRVMAVAAADQV